MKFTLAEIARRLGSSVTGDGEKLIDGVASIEAAGPGDITFAVDPKWIKALRDSQAQAAVVGPGVEVPGVDCIQVDNPQLAFTRVVRLFHPIQITYGGVSPLAHVDESAFIGEPIHIGPFASIGADSKIGAGCSIAAGCRIGARVAIGEECILHPNVVIEDRVTLCDRTIIHSGTVIGADGYGYVQSGGTHHKIPQVGGVRIGSDVEIGANVCVDRGALGDTVIGDGVKIDNLVQIAHSVEIGDNVLIVGGVSLAGSVKIGKGAVIAGRAGVVEHVTIGDGAIVYAHTLITHDVKPGAKMAGYPGIDLKTWRRSKVIERSLPGRWSEILELIKKSRGDTDK